MIRSMALTMFSIAVALAPFPSKAANATLEKCTCDLARESVLNNGASVRNATACWSTEDRDRQWCDITVQAIEGEDRQQTIISQLVLLQSDPRGMTAFLQQQTEEAISSGVATEDNQNLSQAIAELPSLIKVSDKLTVECVRTFLESRENKGKFQEINQARFSCNVGDHTGWLRMAFRVGGISFIFMISPNA